MVEALDPTLIRALQKQHARKEATSHKVEGTPERRPRLYWISNSEKPQGAKRVLMSGFYKGPVSTFMPALQELAQSEDVIVDVLADGQAALEIERTHPDAPRRENIHEGGAVTRKTLGIEKPDVIMITTGTPVSYLELSLVAEFQDVPYVIYEENYTSSHNFIHAVISQGLPLPKVIIVMDAEARELLLARFPELRSGVRIEVTGIPTADVVAREDTEKISNDTRALLSSDKAKQVDALVNAESFHPSDKIVFYVGIKTEPGRDQIASLKAVLASLSASGFSGFFAFRWHPGDTPQNIATYRALIKNSGIRALDTQVKIDGADIATTNQVAAASDLVIHHYSTEGHSAAIRRKPVVRLGDTQYVAPLPNYPEKDPMSSLGAAEEVTDTEEVGGLVNELLNQESDRAQTMRSQQETFYNSDGKNTARAVLAVKSAAV